MAREEAGERSGPATPEVELRIAELDAAAGRLGAALGAQLADPRLAWLPAALRRTAETDRQRTGEAAAAFHAAFVARTGALSVRRRRLLARCDAYVQRVTALERRSRQFAALAELDAAGIAAAVVAFMRQLHAGLAEPAVRIERSLIDLERELTRVRRRAGADGPRSGVDALLVAMAPLVPQVGRLGRLLGGAAGVGAEAIVDEAFSARGVSSPTTFQHTLRTIAENHAVLAAAGKAFGAAAARVDDPDDAVEPRRLEVEALLARLLGTLAPLAAQAPRLQAQIAELQRKIAAVRPRGAAMSDGALRALLAASTEGAAAPRYRVSPGSKSSSTFAPFGS